MLKNIAFRVVVIYLIIGGLYMFFSDWIVQRFVTEPATLTRIQTYKGLGYVVVTGILIYFLIQTQLNRLKKTDQLLKEAEELNERLNHTMEELRELDKRRNMLISTMGHELRTPLNSIIGFADILFKEYSGAINKEQAEQLMIIKNNARHLLSLINDVVEIGRIELIGEKLSLTKINLNGLISEIIDSFKPAIEKKGLSIEIIPDRIEIFSDEKRIRQIPINLLSNAIKFTEKGSIKIELVDAGDFVDIIVQDTGCGIDPEDMRYLFEPFGITHFKKRPGVEGTGLGLYICKRIVSMLNGEIFVESQPNKGTKFVVKLKKKMEVV
uniref:histidine kinase n=1 Tax=candidate division WOR-3 bacterium TaxID=2052148 RepID=A0A7V1EHJ0_UNCW3